MRKQYKDKRRACKLCKPHKRGWSHRWKEKDRVAQLVALEEMETGYDAYFTEHIVDPELDSYDNWLEEVTLYWGASEY